MVVACFVAAEYDFFLLLQCEEETERQCEVLQSEERHKEERQTNWAFHSLLQVNLHCNDVIAVQ